VAKIDKKKNIKNQQNRRQKEKGKDFGSCRR